MELVLSPVSLANSRSTTRSTFTDHPTLKKEAEETRIIRVFKTYTAVLLGSSHEWGT
jgi:hypothetical protein